jgi:dihydropteroate synthase
MGISGVEDTKFRKNKLIRIKDHLIDFSTPKVMGIVNATPDSFFEQSRMNADKHLLKHIEQMIVDGADIIDIGGVSTRPGANLVSIEEERMRVIPAIQSISKAFPELIISIDTFRSEVADEAINCGASLINDISGWQFDERIIDVAKSYHVPYILMHCAGTFETMHQSTLDDSYFFRDIMLYFSNKLSQLAERGIGDVFIDPGFGFSKTLEQNFALLDFLPEFAVLERPILVGLSRKSMIYKRLQTTADAALNGTTILNTKAILSGASILRVHDVKEAKEIIRLLN